LPAPAVRRPDIGWRCAGKRGLVQGWILQQKQKWRLLRVRESGPERTALRVHEPTLLRAQARKPVRRQERRLLRHEDRARVGVQVQHQKETLFRFDERVPMRYQVVGQERRLLLRPEPLLFPVPCRPQEREPH
jgi:hypothetical protein